MDDTEQKAHECFARGDFAGAEKLFRQKLAMASSDAAAHYNLGVTLGKQDHLDEALACYRRALELNPAFGEAYINFGICLNELNLIAQARQAFALARKLLPDNANAVLNEGIASLALGDYATGWQDFAARWQLPAYAKFKKTFAKPYWKDEDIAGKTLFLFAEQGFGDTLQMARYVPLLAARGAKIILEVPPALQRLLQNLPGASQIIVKGDVVPDFDFYCAMMDIPGACGTLLETIPHVTPYLFADQAQIYFYRARLPDNKKKRVGLCWTGRASHENDRNRSLKFADLTPMLARADIEWISLQKPVPEGDKTFVQASPLLDWGHTFADFSDAAAAIMNCDLVISVDTAVAHLAGALGKPVFVALPFHADWRWLTARSDSPWYPSARLFRQQKRRDWDSVISQITAAL